MSKKKVNPRRKPASQSRLQKAAEEGCIGAEDEAWAIFFAVLYDKHDFDQNALATLWKEIMRLSADIKNEKIDLEKMTYSLERYTGIVFPKGGFELKSKILTESDARRAKKWGEKVTQSAAFIIFLTALRTVENPGQELLKQVYDEMLYLKDSIDKGYLKSKDLHKVLIDELEIELV